MGKWRKAIRKGRDGHSRVRRESEMKLRTLTLLDKNNKSRLRQELSQEDKPRCLSHDFLG